MTTYWLYDGDSELGKIQFVDNKVRSDENLFSNDDAFVGIYGDIADAIREGRDSVSGTTVIESRPFVLTWHEIESAPDDSCMTRSEADSLLETWNSQKPQLFVLLMREDGEWSELAYGETCISSDEDDMQATVNDLCKNCRDFRGAKFGYSDYPFDSPYIVDRLFDENTYSEE
jgi:hypothetical protein